MMLMAASCPSKRLAAVTMRTGCVGHVQRGTLGHAPRVRRNPAPSRARPSVASAHADRARREGLDLGARAGVPRVRLRHRRRSTGTTSPAASRATTVAWRAILDAARRAPSGPTTPLVAARVRVPRARRPPRLRRPGRPRCSPRTTRYYENWDQDATAVEERYGEQDPAAVAARAGGGRRGARRALRRRGGRRQWDAHRPAQRWGVVHRRLDRPLLPARHRAPHLGRHRLTARARA